MSALHILLLFSCVFTSQAINCPPGWKGFNTSCYHFSHDQEPWMLAMLICPGYGGHLVEIETQEEEIFLETEVVNLPGSYYWIGANDLEIEGVWRWWRTKEMVVPRWGGREPNNAFGGENCAQIVNAPRYGWNDHNCTYPFHYICEIYG